MRKLSVNGWFIEVFDESLLTPDRLQDMSDLLENHKYNLQTDWEKYRKIGALWRKQI